LKKAPQAWYKIQNCGGGVGMGFYHTVLQGECLASISKRYGFLDYRTVYNAPENQALRQKRPHPNLLYPGDQVYIPSKESKKEQRSTGATHTFRISRQTVQLRIVLKSSLDKPYVTKKYELAAGGQVITGKTDSNGLLQAEISADISAAKLTLWPGDNESDGAISWNISIGHLDPFDTATGAQARLNNLGFYCGAVDGIVGPKTERALRAFQIVNGLPATGVLDAATCSLLNGKHDSL
jgi:N-acetylmuramoyl-L-alanine amidase